jgi:hypothetical protein
LAQTITSTSPVPAKSNHRAVEDCCRNGDVPRAMDLTSSRPS